LSSCGFVGDGLSAFVYGFYLLGMIQVGRVIDHRDDGHGHVGSHDIGVRHAKEYQERHYVTFPQKG